MIAAKKTCFQKFAHREETIHPALTSFAVFARGTLWNKGDIITVSFLPPDDELSWEYSIEQLTQLSSQDIEFEKSIRKLNNYSEIVKRVINIYVQPIVPTIKFQFVDSGGDVRVRFNSKGGSYSLVGTGCKVSTDEFTLTLGWLDVGTIIHEFSHVLGMLHELQNPSEKIPWNTDAVYEYYKDTNGWDSQTTYENVLKPDSPNSVTNSAFDAKSVMIYPIPANLTTNGFHTNINLRYSATDIKWIGDQYNVDPNIIKKNIEKFTSEGTSNYGGYVGSGISSTNVGSSSMKKSSLVVPLLLVGILVITLVLYLFLSHSSKSRYVKPKM